MKRNYIFFPIAFETLGAMGEDTFDLLSIIAKLLHKKTGEARSIFFVTVEIQRGNAASILKTLEENGNNGLNNVFNILQIMKFD